LYVYGLPLGLKSLIFFNSFRNNKEKFMDYDINWAKLIQTSYRIWSSCTWTSQNCIESGKIHKGYSSQVKLFPVSFESGHGVTLHDVDGNIY
jgi:hypothetical protein